MFDLFSDIFACGDNGLSRLDTRVKLVVAMAAIVSVLVSTGEALPLAVLGLCVGAMLAVRIPVKLVVLRLLAPVGMVAVLVILQSLMVGSTPLLTVVVWHWQLTATVEGTRHGLLLGSRVLGGVSVMLLLSSVTPAHGIFSALRWFGAPREWVEIAMLMYRYAFARVDDAGDVAAAQRLRLGYAGVKRSLASFGALIGTVIIRSLDQATSTHEAMLLRGYTGSMPSAPPAPLGRRDWWVMGTAVPALLIALLILERRWL
jgi:cobalt/nickel transport system permease protein